MVLAWLALPAVAEAAKSQKKMIWGPPAVNGVSQFPIYDELGAGIYQTVLFWSDVAPTQPANPDDPDDPAYRWPEELDFAVSEARRYGIKVAILLRDAPRWANGDRPSHWAPTQPQEFARFAATAARRYTDVNLWQIWGEPSRRANFMPLRHERRGRPLSREARRGPRLYSQILDASYQSLKQVRPQNLVIGGNTFTTGDISPLNFIKAMRLPDGKPPRMDMYGHNPFTRRRPNLRDRPLGFGFADFSDLDELADWVDRYLSRPGQRRLRLFLSEFFLPTDHPTHEFNFYVTRKTQASFLASALRITRRWSRIYTLGWFTLYDEAPRPGGDETNRGLIDQQGRRKPAFNVFKRG